MITLSEKEKRTVGSVALWSTILMLAIIPVQIAVFAALPMPSTGREWIEMFGSHPIGSLLHLDLLYVVNNALICVIYVGIFVLLMDEAGGLALLGVVLGLVGAAAYFPTVRAAEIQQIAALHGSIDDESFRTALEAVVEGMLAVWQGTGFAAYYLLNAFSLLLFSIGMFRSSRFARPISIFALLSAVFMMIPSTFGAVGLVFSLLSLVPWIVFSIMLALRLRRYVKSEVSTVG